MSVTSLKSRLSGKIGSAAPLPTPEVSVPNPTESNYLALTTNAMSIINENLKHQPLSHQLFDIIKAPTGGTTAFTVPGLTGDEIQKEIVGLLWIIPHQEHTGRHPNQYKVLPLYATAETAYPHSRVKSVTPVFTTPLAQRTMAMVIPTPRLVKNL